MLIKLIFKIIIKIIECKQIANNNSIVLLISILKIEINEKEPIVMHFRRRPLVSLLSCV